MGEMILAAGGDGIEIYVAIELHLRRHCSEYLFIHQKDPKERPEEHMSVARHERERERIELTAALCATSGKEQ
jgi:hypothetical protein